MDYALGGSAGGLVTQDRFGFFTRHRPLPGSVEASVPGGDVRQLQCRERADGLIHRDMFTPPLLVGKQRTDQILLLQPGDEGRAASDADTIDAMALGATLGQLFARHRIAHAADFDGRGGGGIGRVSAF